MIEHHEANITGYIFCDIQKTFVGQHFIFIVVFFQETSFQVVLISDGHFSFVLINFGTIAPAQRYVQVCTTWEIKSIDLGDYINKMLKALF